MLGEPQRDEALVHFQRGLVLEQANRVDEAVEEYRRALAHNPHLAEAHDALGSYYQRQGLLAKAAEEYRIVANLEGGFLAYFNIGCVLIELERYDEAIDAFLHCLAVDADDPAVHYELGQANYLRGDDYAALYHLQIARSRYPNDCEIHRLIGNCHLRLGAYDEAEAAFQAALHHTKYESTRQRVRLHLRAVARHREIGEVRSARDRLYAEYGIACIGSTHDHGQELQESGDFHFTYPDIAVSLRRLIGLAQAQVWRLTCVVPIDRLAEPLAEALAALVGIPVRHADALVAHDVALLTLAVGHEAEMLKLAIERAHGSAVSFCLGLNWIRHSATVPDVVGVVVRDMCSVPWESELRRLRAQGASTEAVDYCLGQASRQITDALRTASQMPDVAQLAFFTSCRGLRYLDRARGTPIDP